MSDRVSSASSERSAVGELLRATRLRYGWDLEDVEVALRIRLSHLEAIESGRLQDLPGAAYAVGFVRAYADHLGLDREEVVARFREEISDLPNRTQLNFPKPIPESRVPSAIVLLVAAALAVGAYGGWYYVTVGKRANVESVAEVPQQLAQESPADISGQTTTAVPTMTAPTTTEAQATEVFGSTATPPAETGASPEAPVAIETPPAGTEPPQAATAEPSQPVAAPFAAPSGSPAEAPAAAAPSGAPAATASPPTGPAPVAGSSGAAPSTQAAESGVTPPEEEPASEEAPLPDVIVNEDVAALPPAPDMEHTSQAQVFGQANTNARIVIRANADSWVQVRDGRGQLVLTRMLRAGDSYRVPNQPGLSLLTGNAGALEIFVDGHKVPPIGPGGAIRRDVALDADRLLSGTAIDY